MIDRNLGLLDNLSGNLCFVAGDHSTGVDNLEGSSAPSHRPVDAIASDAGFVSNYRSPLTNEAVEKSGLADIRSADDCYQELCHRHAMNFAFLLEDSTSNEEGEFSGWLVGGVHSSEQHE
jgi:hypothetical protein